MKRWIPLMVCIALQACAGGGGGSSTAQLVVAPPANEQWSLVAPAEQGMDGALLGSAVSALGTPQAHGLASMLVLRHGKPVFEQYWNGYGKDSLHDMRSATKSITSLMVGVAIGQGMLSGPEEPISKQLAAAYPDAPALKGGLTLAHLLTMRSGLACDDFTGSSPGNEERMYQSADWVKFFLDLPARYTPGTVTRYCTGGVVALGRVIAESSKRPIPQFAEQFLFGPLGVAGARWADFDNHRQTDTGGHLHLRPRDMARIGQLVLQKGQWDGRQLVPAEWITLSTREHTRYDNGARYGYLWWLKSFKVKGRTIDAHYADGNGGQFIFVVPELDLVAVFTGENYNDVKASQAHQIMEQYVLPSVQ